MLVWDNTAREWLARLYVDKQPAKAVAMVEEIVAAGGGRVISAPLRLKYWEALQSSGQQEKVAKDMDDAIATGPRDLVPQAQVMRGNLRRAAGKKDAALEDYLRTILFFESAGPARAEALFKAAELLDELADPQRAAALRQMLIQQYPDSDLARKAGGKV
jgi:TolA-binding protein